MLAPGQRTPILVTREMVRSMKPRSVIMDVSIDEGGCVETSRPTTHEHPTYIEEGILHYCVPNMPGRGGAHCHTCLCERGHALYYRNCRHLDLKRSLSNPSIEPAINTHNGKLLNLVRLSAQEEIRWTATSIYQSRVTTAQEAVKAIKSGHRVFLTGNVSVPQKLLAALVEYAPNVNNVEICQALTVGSADYVSPEMEGHLRVNSMFISANIRKAVQEGRADFTPVLLSEFPLLFKRGILPLDVAIIHVSTPDEHGFCSLGVEVGLDQVCG